MLLCANSFSFHPGKCRPPAGQCDGSLSCCLSPSHLASVNRWTGETFTLILNLYRIQELPPPDSNTVSFLFHLTQPSFCVRAPADARPQQKHPEPQEAHLAVQRHRGPSHGRDALRTLGNHAGPQLGFKSGSDLGFRKPPKQPGAKRAQRLF